jgi:hypothetical protein
MCIGLHVKYPLSCQIVIKFEVLGRFSKNTQISNFILKTRPVRAELFRADRRTDRYDEANSSSSKFCERARKLILDKVLCNIPESIPGNTYLCHSRSLAIHQSHNDPNNRIYSTNSVQKASSDILQNNKHKTTRYRT